jgi:hypothetical protein
MKKKLIILYGSVLVMFILCFSLMTVKKKRNTEEKIEQTESRTELATEAGTDSEYSDAEQETSEAVSSLLSEENYIETIKQVITGQINDQTPVSKQCLDTFDPAGLTDIISIEEIPEMCSYSDRKACFNITTEAGTQSYAAGFTIVNGKMNYLEIYYVPGAEGGV